MLVVCYVVVCTDIQSYTVETQHEKGIIVQCIYYQETKFLHNTVVAIFFENLNACLKSLFLSLNEVSE